MNLEFRKAVMVDVDAISMLNDGKSYKDEIDYYTSIKMIDDSTVVYLEQLLKDDVIVENISKSITADDFKEAKNRLDEFIKNSGIDIKDKDTEIVAKESYQSGNYIYTFDYQSNGVDMVMTIRELGTGRECTWYGVSDKGTQAWIAYMWGRCAQNGARIYYPFIRW